MNEGRVLDAHALFRTLGEHRVDFVVIGALGALLHGAPHATHDLDICPSEYGANPERLSSALNQLEAGEWLVDRGEFVARQWSAELLSSDRMWILSTRFGLMDVVFEPAGTRGFADLATDAVTMEIQGIRVLVASLNDIIRSKEAVGRDKDRLQLPALRRLQERIEGEQ